MASSSPTSLLLWTPTSRAALLEFLPAEQPTRIDRLATPKNPRLARKLVTLAPPPTITGGALSELADDLVPVVESSARLLQPTISHIRRALPEARSVGAIFEASRSRDDLPLEAKVPWRSDAAPPWSPYNADERRLLEHSLKQRSALLATVRYDAQRLPRVPRTTQRNPQFNSSQLGLYRDWPKGLLRPPKELHMPTSPTAKQLAPRSASWGQLPAVNLGESVRSVVR